MITSSYGLLSGSISSPTLVRTLLFALGATVAFIAIETLAARGLRQRDRGERSEIVALGSALNLASVGSGIGLAALAPVVLAPTLAWPVASFAATFAYLLFAGAELAVAEQLEVKTTRGDPRS